VTSHGDEPLAITAVRVMLFDTRETGGRTVAYAEVEISGALLLRGIRILESKKRGLFLGFPSQKARRDTYVDVMEPLTKEARSQLREAVIGEYKRLTGWEPAAREVEGPA
jgi:DNA-binding cell septation regulator SpoVG